MLFCDTPCARIFCKERPDGAVRVRPVDERGGHLSLQGPDIQPGVPITETLRESCPVVWGSLNVSLSIPPPFPGVGASASPHVRPRHHVFLHLRWVLRREAAWRVFPCRSQALLYPAHPHLPPAALPCRTAATTARRWTWALCFSFLAPCTMAALAPRRQ